MPETRCVVCRQSPTRYAGEQTCDRTRACYCRTAAYYAREFGRELAKTLAPVVRKFAKLGRRLSLEDQDDE